MNILKTKAPIVAIPVEGKAPVCVDGKRLRTWAKAVKITSLDVVTTGGDWYCVEQRPQPQFGSGEAEGPVNLIAERTVEVRKLRIVGRAGRVRTACTMNVIDRRTAVKKLGEWSEKERERIAKRVMRGALDTKAVKRAKFEDEGEGMVAVSCTVKDRRVEKLGLPVTIPEFSQLSCVLVKWENEEGISFSVTESVTGSACGFGKTGEEAIFDARTKAKKLSADVRAKILAKVLKAAA